MNIPKELVKINPFTLEILYTHPQHKLIDIVKLIQAANKTFLDWKKSSVEERQLLLEKIITNYQLNKNEIISAEALDQGLSEKFTEKANYEVGLRLLKDFKKQLLVDSTNRSPNGVTVVILSWNLSNRLFIERALSAWLSGNAVIVKVSSLALTTALQWQHILKVSHVPENTIQFVMTDDEECKKLLVSHPGIKAVSVTGTLKTCASIFKIQSQLAEKQFKKLQLSCGSKNSCIVLDEPDVALTEKILETFLNGQGQLVWNSSRLFILEKFQDAWKDAIKETLDRIRPAQDPNDNSMWGPVIKKYPHLSYEKLLETAKKDQAKFIQGPVNRLGAVTRLGYLNPVFTYDMSNCSELQQDELNLPLYVLSAVKYGFDVPKYSNVSYYGHSTCVFSKTGSLEKITSQLEVGRVSINNWSIYNELNIKAVKQSAFGSQDHQIFGEFNSNVKNIS